jgi:hypothetical protein
LYDGFGSVVNGDEGEVEFFVGDSFEEGLDEFGGALGAGEAFVFAGVLKAHGGGDIDDEEEVAAFFWFDFFDFGAVGFWFDIEEGGEGPGEACEEKNAEDGGEDGEGGESSGGSEGEVADFGNAAGVQEFGTGGENGGG